MCYYGYLLDISIFNVMILMYGKKGMMDKVIDIFVLLWSIGLELDVVIYNCLMGMYGWEGMYWKCEVILRECMVVG